VEVDTFYGLESMILIKDGVTWESQVTEKYMYITFCRQLILSQRKCVEKFT